MRCFIAFELPKEIQDYLVKLQGNLAKFGDNAKLNLVKSFHLTLKFLGEVDSSKIDDIKKALQQIKAEEMVLNLGKQGFFPNEDFIRVVWISLIPDDKIIELQKNIDESLSKLGFKKEKDFKAHLTLARVKFVKDKEAFTSKIKSMKIEEKQFKIKGYKLIKSTLTKQGPIYEDLAVF